MNWRVAFASEIGTSHIAVGSTCEDSCWAQDDTTTDGASILSVFVSDGAGTASHAAEGAELAIQTAAAFVASKLSLVDLEFSEVWALECVTAIRNAIFAHASEVNLTPRDFACTFLGAISLNVGTLAMQIGDGGVVLDRGRGLEVAIAPMSGEYANMTHFVTQEDACDVLVSKIYTEPVTRLAVFSDGIQRLALNMATNTAHEPFFTPFFNVLSTSALDQQEELNSALGRFLGSKAVNERTDDDKTLALAILAS